MTAVTRAVPRYLLRDRDGCYGLLFREQVKGLDIQEVLIAARRPWQNPYCERLIGSIRRDCSDHVIIFSELHLRRILKSYFQYYHGTRTHLALDKDAPDPRLNQRIEEGVIRAFPQVGGLHHRYERQAA